MNILGIFYKVMQVQDVYKFVVKHTTTVLEVRNLENSPDYVRVFTEL